MDLDAFFKEEGIFEYAIVRFEDLPYTDRSGPLHLIPSACSVIVFGTTIPAPVYEALPKEKTQKMLRIAESLDLTAVRLAGRLNAEQFRSAIVPLSLPLQVESGRVQGIVRLKQIAALSGLGTIGRSTSLYHPATGPGLYSPGLSPKWGQAPQKPRWLWISVGTACGVCGHVPGGAISADGVNVFRCRNISPWIPAPLVPGSDLAAGSPVPPAPCSTLRTLGCPSCNHAMQPLCDCLPVFPWRGRCKRTDKDVILPGYDWK